MKNLIVILIAAIFVSSCGGYTAKSRDKKVVGVEQSVVRTTFENTSATGNAAAQSSNVSSEAARSL
jgi:hypothetical protein